MLFALRKDLSGAEDDLGALGGGGKTPGVEGFLGGGDREIDVFGVGALEYADDVAGVGGIEVLESIAGAGGDPFAADEVLVGLCCTMSGESLQRMENLLWYQEGSRGRQTHMQHFKLTLAYDGTDFHGWQVQPGRPSIQGELAAAIERVCGERVLPQGSGRTDAGVHALAQTASISLEAAVPAANLALALNRTLPVAIRVTAVEQAPPEFHARKSAISKLYRYRIARAAVVSPFLARYVWHYPYPLDEGAMIACADAVVGEHDFTTFAAVDPQRRAAAEERSKVRRILLSQFQRAGGDELVYEVRGNGFLHHMVRNLVGAFVLVGKGALTRAALIAALAARDRSLGGPTAPASGLALVSVEY